MSLDFANPHYVHLLWPVLATAALLVWLEFHRSARLGRFISKTMQNRLVTKPTVRRRLLKTALLALAGVSLTFAMMRPQWGLHYVESRQMGAEIMVCLDVSKSMLAEDVAPSRLERAKAEIADLLSMMDEDHVGLIAFAGKATVLSPMTPDHGFLKLILDQAGPSSVARGGTDLEAPIRKALAGFRSEADISRVIVLITDGEDHDSFPREAAKDAFERGVRIIAIGFGDENGSEIMITDPQTGARNAVVDSTGSRVLSRLDGELLRDIALATEGVYVPAGTGALDLRSIYDTHIAPLTRASLTGAERRVCNEAYQWFVVIGIAFAVGGALASGGSQRKVVGAPSPRSSPSAGTHTATISLAVLLVLGHSVSAQTTNPASQPTTTQAAASDESAEPADPRELYNRGLAFLQSGELGRAEEHLLDARTRAGADGDVRYRATFNLGWVDVKRADGIIADQPAEALKHLQAAADWFRDAVRLRPKEEEPRRNLELISRRILELADALRDKEAGDLAGRLDALIVGQRGRLVAVGGMVQVAADRPNQTDSLRREFRQLGLEQRKTLSEILDVTDLARGEHDGIEAIEADTRSPEQRVRLAQLQSVRDWCERASQRVGQARSQLRRRQAERAYRRVAASVDVLKRARDQLRDPAEVLSALITDTAALMQHTAVLRDADRARIEAPTTSPADGELRQPAPAWLTSEFLDQTQEQITERTAELQARLAAGITQLEGQTASSSSASPGTPADDAERKRKFLQTLQSAVPLIEQAALAFGRAQQSLAATDLRTTFSNQAEGLTHLARARELFLDIRGLIELMYADEKRIEAVLAATEKNQDKGFEEYLPMLREVNAANRKRADRLDGMLDDSLAAAETPPPAGAGPDPSQSDPEQKQAELQQLTMAKTVLGQIKDEWRKVDQLLAEGETLPDGCPQAMREHVAMTLDRLEVLRRLFFTLVEHLRDTLRRQVDLNDRTQTAADDPNADRRAEKAAPLADEQEGLAEIADQIGQALRKQSQQGLGQVGDGSGDPKMKEQVQQAAEMLAEAAEKVAQSHGYMTSAAKGIAAEIEEGGGEPDLRPARGDQDLAAERLAEALALLSPQNDQKQQKPEGQDQQDGGDEQKQTEDNTEKQQRQMDTAGMLQAIRDRQQQRQRDRDQRRPAGYEPVDRDW